LFSGVILDGGVGYSGEALELEIRINI